MREPTAGAIALAGRGSPWRMRAGSQLHAGRATCAALPRALTSIVVIRKTCMASRFMVERAGLANSRYQRPAHEHLAKNTR